MTENNKNRFTDNETDCLIDSSFTDNLTKKIYVIDEWERIIGLCNNLWEQTQRFEKENQRLNTEIEQLKEANKELKKESYGNLDGLETYKALYSDLSEKYDNLEADFNDLRKENEQLKETNQELYDFRLVLNALLFNEWAETGKYEVYKSKRHYDGELCFDGDWFIVVAILPSGQVTNHYHIKYWDYFKIPSYPKVKDEFDGHTSSVVLSRYGVILND